MVTQWLPLASLKFFFKALTQPEASEPIAALARALAPELALRGWRLPLTGPMACAVINQVMESPATMITPTLRGPIRLRSTRSNPPELVVETVEGFVDADLVLLHRDRFAPLYAGVGPLTGEAPTPAAATPEPPAADPVISQPAPRHPGGRDPDHGWEGAASHVTDWVAKHGPLPRHANGKPNKARAIELMVEWFKANEPPPLPTPQTFYKWFKSNPHLEWWGLGA